MELVSVMAKVGSRGAELREVAINPRYVSNIVFSDGAEHSTTPATVWLSGNSAPFFMSEAFGSKILDACKIPETIRLVEVIVTSPSQH